MHRFYLPNFQQPVLTGAEAHHCRDVLRLKVGDEIEVFDGRGHAARCRITEAGRQAVRVQAFRHWDTPSVPCRITLAQAIPRKNMDLIVQKATELGVTCIAPVISERTVKRVATNPARWHEIALESCKQCGNNWLPEIRPAQPLRDFLASVGGFDLKLAASLQPGSRPLKAILAEAAARRAPAADSGLAATVLILIGPEGDFTADEYAAAQAAGCEPLSLGPLVLRADTAAIYTLSILHHELQVRMS